MAKLKLKIVTPEKQIFDKEVDQVNVQTSDGVIGILPNHTNLMAKIIPGELTIKDSGKISHLVTGEGFLQVASNTLVVMTDLAQSSADIDERAVEEAKKRAEEALQKQLSDEEVAETMAIIEKSLAQLRVKRRHHIRQ